MANACLNCALFIDENGKLSICVDNARAIACDPTANGGKGCLFIKVDGSTITYNANGELQATVGVCTELLSKVVVEATAPPVPIPLGINDPAYTQFDPPFSATIVNPSTCKNMLVHADMVGVEMGLDSYTSLPVDIQLQPYLQEDGGPWGWFNDGGSDIDFDSDNLDLNTLSLGSSGWHKSWVIGAGASKTIAQRREYRRGPGDTHPYISESHRIDMWGIA